MAAPCCFCCARRWDVAVVAAAAAPVVSILRRVRSVVVIAQAALVARYSCCRAACCACSANDSVVALPSNGIRPRLTGLRLQQGFAAGGMGFRVSLYGGNPEPLMSTLGHSGHPEDQHRCPLYPQKRTLVERVVTSALCQKQTFCTATRNDVIRWLLSHGRSRHVDAERLGGFERK
jgi:hypothetical protein